MSSVSRIASFAALLAVVFAAAVLAGGAIDPSGGDDSNAGSAHAEEKTEGHGTNTGAGDPAADAPRGLAVADGELRLVVADTDFDRGRTEPLRFRIEDAEGRTVSDFDVEHERRMHLIAVRRDLTGYQHLHPRRMADGSWQTDVRFGDAGVHRIYADFSRAGEPHTLGADVTVAGAFDPQPLPHPADTAEAGDGYQVSLVEDGHDLVFQVTEHGRAVTDIEPYLGARGHLVALREGDLAFLHVHPADAATAGDSIRFGVEYPSDGRYRLFLQFKHDGEVRTAAFTREEGDDGHGH